MHEMWNLWNVSGCENPPSILFVAHYSSPGWWPIDLCFKNCDPLMRSSMLGVNQGHPLPAVECQPLVFKGKD
eukprot:scaffold112267_cov15-Tisochrysis_lutea.AAC.1